MKKIISAFAILPLLAGFTACDENKQFEGELYKKVIYVLSDDDLMFKSEHQMGSQTTGYLTLYCGGTEHLQEDVTVELEFDDTALDEYNYRYFDLDTEKYAKKLPEECYTIESMKTVLRADSPDNYSLLPIKVNLDGLSPDTVYVIPMRIKSISNYEVNPKKQAVMYNPLPKNQYASVLNTTYYQTTALEVRHLSSGDVTSNVSVTRPVVPVGRNSIRMFAGAHTYAVGSLSAADRDKYSMSVTLNDDGTIKVESISNLVLEQLDDPDYNNYYVNQKTGYLTLLLKYRYMDNINGEDCWVTMTETSVRRISDD